MFYGMFGRVRAVLKKIKGKSGERGGFTLIELLACLACMALIALIAQKGMAIALKAQRSGASSPETRIAASIIGNKLADELRFADGLALFDTKGDAEMWLQARITNSITKSNPSVRPGESGTYLAYQSAAYGPAAILYVDGYGRVRVDTCVSYDGASTFTWMTTPYYFVPNEVYGTSDFAGRIAYKIDTSGTGTKFNVAYDGKTGMATVTLNVIANNDSEYGESADGNGSFTVKVLQNEDLTTITPVSPAALFDDSFYGIDTSDFEEGAGFPGEE